MLYYLRLPFTLVGRHAPSNHARPGNHAPLLDRAPRSTVTKGMVDAPLLDGTAPPTCMSTKGMVTRGMVGAPLLDGTPRSTRERRHARNRRTGPWEPGGRSSSLNGR